MFIQGVTEIPLEHKVCLGRQKNWMHESARVENFVDFLVSLHTILKNDAEKVVHFYFYEF
jgi:hypothetical protein